MHDCSPGVKLNRVDSHNAMLWDCDYFLMLGCRRSRRLCMDKLLRPRSLEVAFVVPSTTLPVPDLVFLPKDSGWANLAGDVAEWKVGDASLLVAPAEWRADRLQETIHHDEAAET